MKTYTGRIVLKSHPRPIQVSVDANSQPEAKRIIEAQYAGQIKTWASSPVRVY